VIDDNPHNEAMTYQSLQADMYLEGNVAQTLRDLTEAVKGKNIDQAVVAARRESLAASHDALVAKKKAQREEARAKTPIDPLWLCEALNNVMPDGTIYIDEVTTHTGLLRQHLDWNLPQSLFTRQGGLGQGLGLSLGIKLAKPDRPVVTLIGDGAFLYNPALGALGAARDFSLPTLTVIFNNKKYAAMQGMHLQMYPDGTAVETDTYHGTHINAPDFAKVAEAFGAYGEQVTDPEALEAALERGLKATREGKSAILDVIVG
jgi:acetolactate synthase-1/2/3 large subunit